MAVDWSGAKGSRHRGIAVAACAVGDAAPRLIDPPGSFWSRTGVRDWLIAHRTEPLLVGFDFSFSAPFVDLGAHLPGEPATADAKALWAHVEQASDDDDLGAASFLDSRRGRLFYLGAADGPKARFIRWRTCDSVGGGVGKTSTVFDAIGAAQVAKASFAGMRLLHAIRDRIAIWPFDPMPAAGMVVTEIYTAIAARAAGVAKGRTKIRDAAALDGALAALGSRPHEALARYDDHATDAIVTAAWLRASATRDALWQPAAMTPSVAATEGWTFGIG